MVLEGVWADLWAAGVNAVEQEQAGMDPHVEFCERLALHCDCPGMLMVLGVCNVL